VVGVAVVSVGPKRQNRSIVRLGGVTKVFACSFLQKPAKRLGLGVRKRKRSLGVNAMVQCCDMAFYKTVGELVESVGWTG
jgi:hypothetical protein